MTLTRLYSISFFLFILLLNSCSSSRKAAQQFEELPNWIKQKPQNSLTYFGVGKAAKKGFPDRYIKTAEREALTDLAEHISVKVNTSSLLYQFDIDNQKSDFYMNKQNIQSSNFFEGYTVSKTYENEDYYWNLIEISKEKYEAIRQKRKTTTLDKAYEYYVAATLKKENKDLYAAASLYVKSLETLKPYWGDKTLYTTESGKSFDLTIKNIDEIHLLFKDIQIQKSEQVLSVKRGDHLNSSIPFGLLTHKNYGYLNHFPYKIESSFSLENNKQLFTKDKGIITTPSLEVNTNNSNETISIIVDGQTILKQFTSDLILRKILINSVSKPSIETIAIEVIQPFIKVNISSKDKSLVLDKTIEQTIHHFEKNHIHSPSKKTDAYYKLSITISPLSKESYRVDTNLVSPSKENLFNTSRTIGIDPFVYNTQEKILKSILSTLKRKELAKALEIIE